MERTENQIGPDARLLQALNGFILLIGNDSQQHQQQQQSLNGVHSSPKVDSKSVANYLRLKLLSYLRQLQLQGTITPHRDALIQWWITLLNFLNSDLLDRNNPVEEMNFPDPLLSIDSISVSLECVSRLMSSLMVLPAHNCKDAEIYSHHVLLTIHYVTNRLILNSKHQREFTKQQQQSSLPQYQQNFNRSILIFLNSYTSLLRSFLGKLNAYAFFYLPDDFHYDTQLLLALKPNLSYRTDNTLFLWKRRSFGSAKDQEDRIKPELLENKDTKFFKIVISYMKNDFVFMAFYWHYWYISLRFLAHLNGGLELKSNLAMIPGANVLITLVTNGFVRIDLARFTKFLQSNNNNGFGPNRSDSSEIPSMDGIAATIPSSANGNTNSKFSAYVQANANAGAGVGENHTVTTEKLNDFLFSNFRILRVWECLRNLSGCLEKDPNLPILLSLHDSSQLRYISTIPANDSSVANVIYNKLFQFIAFQFRSLPSVQFLHWDIWFAGVSAMLQTLNSNAQTVALLFLFNIWPHIPIDLRSMLSQQLINDFWDFLTFENDFQLVRVLFLKVLVFRIVPGNDLMLQEDLKRKFQNFYAEMLIIKQKIKEEPVRDRENDLYFYGSKRFFLAPNKVLKEQDLIYRAEKHSHTKPSGKYQNFPTVTSVANVRPSFILRNGRYPYEVFDEMVTKASLLMAERKRKERNSLPTISSASSLSQSEISQSQPKYSSSSKKTGSFSNTINSWFSKLSKNSEQNSQSQCNNSDYPQKQSQGLKVERVKYSSSDESVPFSEASEMLSMYSNVSSIATRRTSSSETYSNNAAGASASSGSGVSSSKDTDISTGSHGSQKKKKLLAPAELKYSSSVADVDEIFTVFKIMITQTESIGRKVERANSNWGIVTAKTYDKPLPVPSPPPSDSSAVSSVIEELNNDSFGIDYLAEPSFEFLPPPPQQLNSESNEATIMSTFSDDPSLPKPNCRFFGLQNPEGSEISTGDSDLLCRFGDLGLGENEDWENEKCIVEGLEQYDEEIIASRRRALRSNRHNALKTRLNKLAKIVRMFNKTVEEYYEYLNFLNHDSIFMDFEVRPPSHTNVINISGD